MVTKMQAVASLTTLIVEVLKDYGLLINIDLIDHQFEIFYFILSECSDFWKMLLLASSTMISLKNGGYVPTVPYRQYVTNKSLSFIIFICGTGGTKDGFSGLLWWKWIIVLQFIKCKKILRGAISAKWFHIILLFLAVVSSVRKVAECLEVFV